MRLSVVILGLAVSGCAQTPPDSVVSAKDQLKSREGLLEGCKDADELAALTISLCESSDGRDHALLVRCLTTPAFLKRLDGPGDYESLSAHKLRVWKVLSAVGKMQGKSAEETILKLGANKHFMGDFRRCDALMEACSEIRKPTSKLLDFLEAQAREEKTSIPLTRVLVQMRDSEASKRVHRWLSAPECRNTEKMATFIYCVELRNDPAIVSLYAAVLNGQALHMMMRSKIVETLFDYRPIEWYGPRTPENPEIPRPPLRGRASTEVLDQLLEIAQKVLQSEMTEEAKQAVLTARKEIEEILAFRRAGGPGRVAKLVIQLDDSSFSLRDAATRELEKYGHLVEPALLDALERNLSLETQVRIKGILAKLHK